MPTRAEQPSPMRPSRPRSSRPGQPRSTPSRPAPIQRSGGVSNRKSKAARGSRNGLAPDACTSGASIPLVYTRAGEGELPPPSNPHCRAPEFGSRESGRAAPPLHPPGALMANRRTGQLHLRVSPAEVADWQRQVGGCRRAAVRPAAAGHGADAHLDRRGGRGRARAHPAGRAHRQQPEPGRALGRTLNASGFEAVEVIVHLVDIARTLAAVARVGGDVDDAR